MSASRRKHKSRKLTQRRRSVYARFFCLLGILQILSLCRIFPGAGTSNQSSTVAQLLNGFLVPSSPNDLLVPTSFSQCVDYDPSAGGFDPVYLIRKHTLECGDQWYLREDFQPAPGHSSKSPFCLPWSVVSDDWWLQHPEWQASPIANATHYCFHPHGIQRAKLFQKIHEIQTPSDRGACAQVFTKKMWQSGWGADFAHVIDGLLHALENEVPFQFHSQRPWVYASAGNNVACRAADLTCYFLPLSSCPPNPDKVYSEHDFWFKNEGLRYANGTLAAPFHTQPSLVKPRHRALIEYASRPHTWLRKAIWDFGQLIPLTSPCSILHVRRADVVSDGQYSRRYHAIREYIELLEQQTSATSPAPVSDKANEKHTIFLLTDDSNAISEAVETYPNYKWVYVPRPRFRGPEGGFENHMPSKDPVFEVVVLQTIFEKSKQCETLVHSTSNFSQFLRAVLMEASLANGRAEFLSLLNIDQGKAGDDVRGRRFRLPRNVQVG